MDDTFKVAAGILSIFVIIIFINYGGTYIGLDPTFANTLVSVLPGIVLFIVGCLVLATQDLGIFAIPAFGGMGLGISVLLGEMNANNIIIDDYVTAGYTLLEIQIFFVIIFFLIGGAVAAKTR